MFNMSKKSNLDNIYVTISPIKIKLTLTADFKILDGKDDKENPMKQVHIERELWEG